ncbi:MAG: hypothetical protein LBO62_01360 [Endomicrobium sp.]|jgi:hypothetical protein|nr:hypothetical protein [Endomicrobium sp.]
MDKKGYLIEYLISDIVFFIMQDEKLDIDLAMKKFYDSEVFAKLQDVQTGLYIEGSGYVYDLYKIERENGYLKQLEI